MKAHYIPNTVKDRAVKAGVRVAQEQIAQMGEDIAKRAQYCMLVAMLDAGLSVRTINRVIKQLPEVKDRYGAYREDGCADYAFYEELRKRGLDVQMTEKEL